MTSTHNIPRYDKEKKKEEERGKREYCLFVCIMILHTYLVFLFFFFICLTTKQNKKQPFHFFFVLFSFFLFPSIDWCRLFLFVLLSPPLAWGRGRGRKEAKKEKGKVEGALVRNYCTIDGLSTTSPSSLQESSHRSVIFLFFYNKMYYNPIIL